MMKKMMLERNARALRQMAGELEPYAPAESMYLCSIAQRLEIKASKTVVEKVAQK